MTDPERLLKLLEAGDPTAVAPLISAAERRQDPSLALAVLQALYASGLSAEAAAWIARLDQQESSRCLQRALLADSEHWPMGQLRVDVQGCFRGEWRLIPAGSFWMGSPASELGRSDADNEPRNRVKLTRSFWLQATPLTQGQWLALTGDNPSQFQDPPNLRRPVERVSWYHGVGFCNAWSLRDGLEPVYRIKAYSASLADPTFNGLVHWPVLSRHGYRLPTEAEWEYAARAGSTTSLYNGENEDPFGLHPLLDQIAWCWDNAARSTHPVAQKQPNAWGLYDMLGNVYEWCWDAFMVRRQTHRTLRNPRNIHGRHRVIRGGSYLSMGDACRVAHRDNYTPIHRSYDKGFRCARTA